MNTYYTIGYQHLVTTDLSTLATGLDLPVVDIRGRPTSRKPGFGRRQLEASLGPAYAWMGDQLGGVNHLEGARDKWPGGARALIDRFERALLLCQCHEPVECHRHQVALVLASVGGAAVRVVHLFEEESIEALEFQRSIDDDDDYDCEVWNEPIELRRAWESSIIERPGFVRPVEAATP